MKRSALPLVRGSVWPGAEVMESQLGERGGVGVSEVAGAVVAHHRFDLHAAFGKPGDRSAQEADGAAGAEIVEHLGVCQPRVVVDHHVHVLPAGNATQVALLAGALLRRPVARHAVSGTADATQLLDVDVHELARAATLVAVGRLGRIKPGALTEADPLEPQRDGRVASSMRSRGGNPPGQSSTWER